MARETNRANCAEPDKGPSVVKLPGAAYERVQQGTLAKTLVARARLFAAQRQQFAYRSPHVRELK